MPNQLAQETSPYLLQHADNPVDWQAWSDDALEQARAEDKPILLSIGYSACHWCHVMAHESFEDEHTAALMNAHFINIKIDREQRPDLDKIYQLAHQIMTQRPGGWPLTMMLDPKTHVPFMAGTYFPKTASHGMPAFTDVLGQVAQWYAQNKDQLTGQKEQLDEVFQRLAPAPADAVGNAAAISAARKQLTQDFDAKHGGFTGAPKFPHPASLELLLRLGARGDTQAAEMARYSLRKMCERGLFDQIGGGFYRYSVDERWAIPHFEKMLYDNGPLLALCSREAYGDKLFTAAAQATGDWVMREMQSPDGGYYASLDTDSEGEEGRYYLWTEAQIHGALAGHDNAATRFELLKKHYGLNNAPNFEGRWHLNIDQPAPEQHTDELNAARQLLRRIRERRERPARDEKILTAWNALMIQGMAVAARQLSRGDYLHSAQSAVDFLHTNLWRDGRLLATYKDGRARFPAYLDDYAYLLDALLDLMQSAWRSQDCVWAAQLAEGLLQHFEDRNNGGFFFTAHDHEKLLHRPKPLADESTAAGNAIAARALLRLGWLLGEQRYLDAAERTLKFARTAMEKYPLAHTSLLLALDDYLQPPEMVIIRGRGKQLEHWQNVAADDNRLVFAIADDAADLPTALATKKAQAQTVAYVCQGFECSPPITDAEQLNNRQ